MNGIQATSRRPLPAFGLLLATLLCWSSPALAEEEQDGHIDIRSLTSGARVLIDGIEVARVPLHEPISVSPGSYTVTLQAPGHMVHTQTVEVEAGEVATIDADLFAFAGILSLTCNAEDATVRIGGQELSAPVSEHEIVTGEHEIVVQAEGYLPSRLPLLVLAGESYDLSVTLVPDPAVQPADRREWSSVFGKWWLWAGVGAVLAGGGAALLAAGGRTVEVYDPSQLPGGNPDAIINPPR
ncbi:MAG: PEGA domain-containing protein [Myxococcota bacterium]